VRSDGGGPAPGEQPPPDSAPRDAAPGEPQPVPHGGDEDAAALHADGAAAPSATADELAPSAADPAPSPEPASEPAPAPEPPPVPPAVEVEALDWAAVRERADPRRVRARMHAAVAGVEALLDREGGPGLLFDADREDETDRAIRLGALAPDTPLWFVGDLHGDLLALEAAIALAHETEGPRPNFVFLGDLFDDGAYGLEVLLRVLELVVERPDAVCLLAGNHDEALAYDGARFTAAVSPSDFAEFLNAHLAHEWIARAGKLAVRLFARAPRALFFPDGLLAAHGGFPLSDLHATLRAGGDWNDPRCLSDFVWTRAHPRARRKMPNRVSRGSQFGHEDFAAFCALSAELGRPVTHMVRGHDHVEERWAVYPAYRAHPMLTTVALSRRLAREAFGPRVRVPTVARWVPGALPQVHRLHIPAPLVEELYPEAEEDAAAAPDAAEAGS
jgi:hypothetical protein